MWTFMPRDACNPLPQLLHGDLAGKVGELVGTDGGDGIVKLGPEIKIWELAHVGRMAKLS